MPQAPSQIHPNFITQVVRVGYSYAPARRALKVHLEKKSWADAALTCHKEGGELVIVDFPEVNKWLSEQKVHNLWIGAHDRVRAIDDTHSFRSSFGWIFQGKNKALLAILFYSN